MVACEDERGGAQRGFLIAFEGGEAAGKSTQAKLLAERIGATLTFEPGATDLGSEIRRLALGIAGPSVAPRAETLLMAADRAQHVAEVIRPALEAGTHVVTDRYIGSSLAYQGYGRALGWQEVYELSWFATEGLHADLVLLLDVPAERAAERKTSPTDRMESEPTEFHRKVANGYQLLSRHPKLGWVAIDGDRPIEEVAESVYAVVQERLGI